MIEIKNVEIIYIYEVLITNLIIFFDFMNFMNIYFLKINKY